MNKIEKIKELTSQLNKYRDLYYNKSTSEVSDFEYDKLFDELVELEVDTGIVISNSPTSTVGYEVSSKLRKVVHEYPMLSLDKTKDPDRLSEFIGNKAALLMMKLDGLTIAVTYENGYLVRAESRGNGEIGEDLTQNAKVFSNLPLTIPQMGKVIVFGEAIIDNENFERINSRLSDDEKYKNPRNLCSGSVRQLDSKICAERNIRFVAWRLVECDDAPNSFMERLNLLKLYGFETVPYVIFNKEHLPGILYDTRDEAKNRGIPIDGCVVSFDDNDYMMSLGATGHHLRGQLAFKFSEDSEETTLRDIEWSMGKTGSLCPVAIFDPVELAGSTVSRASLHNISIVKDLHIKIGSAVTVVKKNEIIPQIIDCDSNFFDVDIPDRCPICGSKTMISKSNNTEVLECTNIDCIGKLLGKLTHAVSKNALNIDGLSESTIEKFIKLGWLKSIKDIYHLKDKTDNISSLEGFGKRSTEKLLESIEESRNTTLVKFLYAQSIPLIGGTASKDISKYCHGDVDEFSRLMASNRCSELLNIDGFGELMLGSICEWWDTYYLEFTDLAEEFTFEKQQSENSNSVDLSGKTFVITGSVHHFKNRNEVKETIENLGGKVSGSVSAKTSYLLNNDIESSSSKNKKAKQFGIPIITEEQLLEMIK